MTKLTGVIEFSNGISCKQGFIEQNTSRIFIGASRSRVCTGALGDQIQIIEAQCKESG